MAYCIYSGKDKLSASFETAAHAHSTNPVFATDTDPRAMNPHFTTAQIVLQLKSSLGL